MTKGEASASTKRRIVEAAIEAIKQKGSAGATARTIAEIAGFNQALIYYHFGSLKGLLIAALDETSDRRLAIYQGQVDGIRTLEDLARVGKALHSQDMIEGHMTVLSELVSACLTHPDLRPQIMARLEPWIDLAEGVVARLIADTFLASMLPSREVAQALVAFYMGMEMLNHLDGDEKRADRLFEMFSSFVPVLSPLLGHETGARR